VDCEYWLNPPISLESPGWTVKGLETVEVEPATIMVRKEMGGWTRGNVKEQVDLQPSGIYNGALARPRGPIYFWRIFVLFILVSGVMGALWGQRESSTFE